MTETPQLFRGIISGDRQRSHADVADRAARIAGGLQRLGVKQGDSVCILMRNDIAFIEAAYAAMQLGAYGVPVNWHFKPEEITYILQDCGTSVLIAHADLLHQLSGAIPSGVSVFSVPTPSEIMRELQGRSRPARHARLRDRSGSLACAAGTLRWAGRAAAAEHDLHLGYDRAPQGRAAECADPGAERPCGSDAGVDLWAEARRPRAVAGTALSFGAKFLRPARRQARRRARIDGAVRARGIPAVDRDATDRHHVRGADHVHPIDEVAGGDPTIVRHVLVASCHPCRSTLSVRRQACDDRMVGPGDLRILRLDRIRRGDVCNLGGRPEKAGDGGPDRTRRGTALHRRGRQGSAARRDRRDLLADRRQPGFHLSQQARQTRRDRPRRLHHLGRCRLYRCRRLRLHLRPQARHGDIRRGEYLSCRNRIGACMPFPASTIARCSAFPMPSSAKR